MLGLRKFILIFGDSTIFWLALFVSLTLRWKQNLSLELVSLHLLPFGAVYLVCLIILYSMGLYSAGHIARKNEWLTSASIGLIILLFFAVSFFYFYSRTNPAITPRGTLLLFWLLFGAGFFLWRIIIDTILLKNLREKTVVIGNDPQILSFVNFLKQTRQYEFEIVHIFPDIQEGFRYLKEAAEKENIQNIILFNSPTDDIEKQLLERLLVSNLNFYDISSFFETRLQKIYLKAVSNIWVLNNVIKKQLLLLNLIKDYSERLFALILFLILLPLFFLIFLLITLTTGQFPLYKQTRIGRKGKKFVIYKFKTMRDDAEQFGPQWATENDPRVTPVGKILRATHLDELPQLINVIKGEMSFVGPRPERPEFVKELEQKIPFYTLRHHLKPGITGWAQINYPYGASLEDAKEKLQYDLYYLKHRNFILNLVILIKTIKLLFQKAHH